MRPTLSLGPTRSSSVFHLIGSMSLSILVAAVVCSSSAARSFSTWRTGAAGGGSGCGGARPPRRRGDAAAGTHKVRVKYLLLLPLPPHLVHDCVLRLIIVLHRGRDLVLLVRTALHVAEAAGAGAGVSLSR